MNSFAVTFLIITSFTLLLLPQRWAPLPLLIGACYITRNQGIEIEPFTFPVLRLLIAAGWVRVLIRGERLEGQMNGLDRLMLIWTVSMLVTSCLHQNPFEAFINRLGLIYDACGIYFLLRIFCRSFDDVTNICCLTAILLLPLAVEMIYEKYTAYNLFSEFGGGSGLYIRMGRVRAQGPFAHAILAGTIGAVCLPMMIGIWHQRRNTAIAGIIACVVMIITCASSGPIMSALASSAALFMWRYRQEHQLRFIRWFAVIIYVAVDLIMKDPAYFLMARVDLAGGSTGWHRSRLIQSAIEHLSEWWLYGTDYTRHWMPSGVTWSTEHTDITNHYLQQGVDGGLPLMLLFIAILFKGFFIVGQTVRQAADLPKKTQFMVWALGASLFSHAVTFISVSYFDQSFLFIYLTLAAIGTVGSAELSWNHCSNRKFPIEKERYS
jgi:hypothetical protein